METIDERKLRLYKFLLGMKRITVDEIPKPYKGVIEDGNDGA